MRFRLGAHGLQVVTAVRSKAGHVKRADRLCRCCSMQVVEDEFHVVFECPLYNEVRLRFSELFRTWCVQLSVDYVTLQISDNAGRMMQQFFAHAKQATVARFISLCLTKRPSGNNNYRLHSGDFVFHSMKSVVLFFHF